MFSLIFLNDVYHQQNCHKAALTQLALLWEIFKKPSWWVGKNFFFFVILGKRNKKRNELNIFFQIIFAGLFVSRGY